MPGETAITVRVPNGDSAVLEAQARLALARERTRGTLTALRSEVSVQMNWQYWYRAHTGAFLAAAFFAGFFLAKRR